MNRRIKHVEQALLNMRAAVAHVGTVPLNAGVASVECRWRCVESSGVHRCIERNTPSFRSRKVFRDRRERGTRSHAVWAGGSCTSRSSIDSASAGTTYGARYAHAPHSPRRPATARAWFLSYMTDGTLYAGRVGHSEAGGRSAE